jgi:hypothetical protein
MTAPRIMWNDPSIPVDATRRMGPTQRRALQVLRDSKGMTRAELQETIGLADLRGAQRLIKTLKARGLLHVARWKYESAGDTCPACPVYVYGPGKDAPKPDALGWKEIKRRYKESVGKQLFNRIDDVRRRGANALVKDGVVVWRRGDGILRRGME